MKIWIHCIVLFSTSYAFAQGGGMVGGGGDIRRQEAGRALQMIRKKISALNMPLLRTRCGLVPSPLLSKTLLPGGTFTSRLENLELLWNETGSTCAQIVPRKDRIQIMFSYPQCPRSTPDAYEALILKTLARTVYDENQTAVFFSEYSRFSDGFKRCLSR